MFAEAFTEPPYGEATLADVDRAFKRFHSQTRKPGFLAALAFVPDTTVAGTAYGCPLTASARWWDTLWPPYRPLAAIAARFGGGSA